MRRYIVAKDVLLADGKRMRLTPVARKVWLDKARNTIYIEEALARTPEEAMKIAKDLGFQSLELPTKFNTWIGKIDPFDFARQEEKEKLERKEKKRLERLAEKERLKKEVAELRALRKEKKGLERGDKK